MQYSHQLMTPTMAMPTSIELLAGYGVRREGGRVYTYQQRHPSTPFHPGQDLPDVHVCSTCIDAAKNSAIKSAGRGLRDL